MFISHCVLLDSLQQRPQSAHTDRVEGGGERGEEKEERGRQIDEKERIPLYTAFSVI